MICPRCGSENPPHGRFCLGCGQPVAAQGQTIITPQPAAPQGPQPQWQHAPPQEERRPVWPLLLVLALLLIGVGTFAVFRARSLATAGQKSVNPGEIQVSTPKVVDSAPITPARPAPVVQPPVTQPGPQQEQMPPQVRAYLRWLGENIDRQRRDMELRGLAEGMAASAGAAGEAFNEINRQLNDDSPGSTPTAANTKAAQSFHRWKGELVGLHRRFTSLTGLPQYWAQERAPGPPSVPPDCALLHGLYRQVMDAQITSSQELVAAMSETDPGKGIARAMQQMGTSSRVTAVIQRADSEVASICAKYRVPQWFKLTPSGGGLSIPGMGGGLGGVLGGGLGP